MTRNVYPFLAVVAMVLALSACGGGGHHTQNIVVVINNKITTIAPGAAVVVVTVTTNDSAGVTFKITAGGVDCQPGCGTLSNTTGGSVDYTPPASVPAAPNNAPTIKATSVTDPTKSDSDPFTIQDAVTNLQLLNGPYMLLVSGFDASGFSLSVAGTFTADGSGNITAGEMDVNDDGAIGFKNPLSGTYTVDANLRGTIALTTSVGVLTTPGFSFTIDSLGHTGDLISLDANHAALSGFFQNRPLVPQPAAVVAARGNANGPVTEGIVLPGGVAGDYVYRLTSDSPVREGAVGRLTIQPDGSTSNGLIDVADIVGDQLTDVSLNGTFQAQDQLGRGTFTITPTGLGTETFAYYNLVGKLYVLEIDAGSPLGVDVFSGEFRAQTVPFANGGDADTSVFGLIGGDAAALQIPASSVAIGQIVINASTATATSDVNDLGFLNPDDGANVTSTGVVTFDLNTGRGTIAFSGGFNNGFLDSVVFYLESSGKGVMMDTTPTNDSTYGEALVGDLVPQNSAAFSNSSLDGNFMGTSIVSVDPISLPAVVGGFTASDSNQTVTGLGDLALAGSPALTNQSVASSYSSISPGTGRGDAVVPATLFGFLNGTVNASFYLVDTNQFYLTALDDGNEGFVESSLGVFNPMGAFPTPATTLSTRDSGANPRVTGGMTLQSRSLRPPVVRTHPRVNTTKP